MCILDLQTNRNGLRWDKVGRVYYTNLLRRTQNIGWRDPATLERIYGRLTPLSLSLEQKRIQFTGHYYWADKEIISSSGVHLRKLTYPEVIVSDSGIGTRGLITAIANHGVPEEISMNVPTTPVVEGWWRGRVLRQSQKRQSTSLTTDGRGNLLVYACSVTSHCLNYTLSFLFNRRWILGQFVGKVVRFSVFSTLLKNCGSANGSGSLLELGC